MNKRNSSIELLKIMSLFLICLSHCVQSTNISFGESSNSMINLILNICFCFGQIGNVIFIICSSYFLLDSKYSKYDKIIKIIFDVWIISILWVAFALIFKINISNKDIIKSFFPMTFLNNWFVVCYILLYLVHPFLNKIINNITQNELLRIVIIMTFLFSIFQCIFPGKYYYNNLIAFIMIYFIIAYVKLYKSGLMKVKHKLYIVFLCITLNIFLIAITNFLGLKITFFANKLLYWNSISNPLYIIMGLSIFSIFSEKIFYNKLINYISSISLIFYLMHENLIFREYIRPLFYNFTLKIFNNLLFWVFIYCIIIFMLGILISILYKETLQKFLHCLACKFYHIFRKTYIKIEDYIISR